MLKAQKEKAKKKEVAKAEDYLKNVESGGKDFVIADIEKDVKKAKKASDEFLTDLETKKLYKITYRRKLADELLKRLKSIDFPKGWKYDVIPTDGKTAIRIYGNSLDTRQGVVMILTSPDGKYGVRAVWTCYKPEIDFKAMRILAAQAENTVDSAKGILLSDKKIKTPPGKKTKSGIYLP